MTTTPPSAPDAEPAAAAGNEPAATATGAEDEPQRQRRSWAHWVGSPDGLAWIALWVMVAFGAAERFSHLDRVSLWFDEWITVEESQRETLWESVIAVASHPPITRLTIRASIWMFGDLDTPGGIDAAARIPAALFGTLTIVMIFLFARRFSQGNLVVALAAAALWTFGGYGIYYSQEARFYAAMVFFSAWALDGVARLRDDPHNPLVHLYLMVPLLLGPLNHALFGLLFLMLFVGVVPKILSNIREHFILVLPWVAAGLMYVPWFVFSIQRLEDQARPWLDNVAWQMKDIPVAFFTGRIGAFHLNDSWAGSGWNDPYIASIAWSATVLLVLGFVIHLVRRRRGIAWLSGFIVILTLIATAAIHDKEMTLRFFHHKYLSFIYPFVCLAFGELIAFAIEGVGKARDMIMPPPPAAAPEPAPATADSTAESPQSSSPAGAWQQVLGWGAWAFVVVVIVTNIGPVYAVTIEARDRMKPGAKNGFHKEPYREAARWAEIQRPPGAVAIVFAPHLISDYAFRHYGVGEPFYAIRKEHIDDPSTFWQPDDPTEGSVSFRPARCIAISGHCGNEQHKLTLDIARQHYPKVVATRWFHGAEGSFRVVVLDAE